MEQFFTEHGDAVISGVFGLLGGSLITLRISKANRGSGDLIDQSKARAGRDLIGKVDRNNTKRSG